MSISTISNSNREPQGRGVRKIAASAILSLAGITAAAASPIMYIHDSDFNFGTVDAETGQTQIIGNLGVQMEDIAFNANGDLYGLTHKAFYSIDRTTGAATRIGRHDVPGGNALVFSDTGTLYAAGYDSNDLYTIDPQTGTGTDLGSTGFKSAGDLAFYNDNFYLASYSDDLVNVNLADLSQSTSIGDFGVMDIYGLATGNDNVFYGVAGTTIYQIDEITGAAENPVDFAGQGFSQVLGQSFYTEAGADPVGVAEPPGLWLATLALLGIGWAARKRRCG